MNEKKKRVSIKDIAQYTGYSIATVSRVINDTNMYYSEETKKKIEDAVAHLHYRPNLVAKGLKESRTYNIAYLVPQIDDFYAGIYDGMQREAHARGYSVVILSSNYSERQEKTNIQHILEKQYDGVIVVTGLLNEADNANMAQVFAGMPVVFIEGIEPRAEVRRVCVDVESICGRAVDSLVALGHRRIAYVSAPCRFETLRFRHQGYRKALERHGIAADESLVFFEAGLELSRFAECYEVMRRVLSRRDFTAMLIMSDWAAFTAIRVMDEMGLKVPEDMSIVGFDNLPFTEFSKPALTTISQNSATLGREGIGLLLGMLEERETDDVFLDADIILRQSISKPAR